MVHGEGVLRSGPPVCTLLAKPPAAPPPLATCSAELATAENCGLHLTVALSYSGRQDLTLAAQELARLAAAGQLCPADITPQLLAAQLATRQLPPAWRDPDLVIRTSGEQRLSNFMCFEAAYSGDRTEAPRSSQSRRGCSCDCLPACSSSVPCNHSSPCLPSLRRALL